jgi:hypothetical protein
MRSLLFIVCLWGCDTSSILSIFMMDQKDMATDQWWHTGPKLPAPRQAAAVATMDGKLYLIGGLDASGAPLASVLALDGGKWSEAPALPEPLYAANVAAVDKRLFVLGGLSGGDVAVGHTWVFDGTAWTARMPLSAERGAAMTAAVDTTIEVAGGLRNGSAVDDFAAYDTVADAWSPRPSLPEARSYGAAAVVAGVFYALGGREAPDRPSDRPSDRIDGFAQGGWTTIGTMPTARANFAAVTVKDGFIVAGGEGELSQVERYTPELARWSILAPMPTPRHALGGALLEGEAHFPGGATQSGAVDVDEVLPP